MGSSDTFDKGFVVVDSRKRSILLSYSKTTLTVKESGHVKVECALGHVLWAEVLEDHALRLSLLQRQKHGLALWETTGSFNPVLREAAVQWTTSLMKAAYEGCQSKRRLKVMINPHGGPGKAISIFEKKIKPIFEAAKCPVDILITEYHKHCYDHCKTMPLDYDVIAVLSGDGLVHEVFNAFAEREDSMDAFALPVVQIPTGSANGFSLGLLGLKDGHDVCAAALNAIKGRHMKLDLCSIQQGDKRIISYMSQAVGMMADVDLGTENLRWMGDSRFMVGFIREVGLNRQCRMKLEIKVASQDKKKMVETYRTTRTRVDFAVSDPVSISEPSVDVSHSAQSHAELRTWDQSHSTLPPLEHTEDNEEWTTIDEPLVYFYAGKLPYVSRDLMQFPIAQPDDGFIDIVAQERISRAQLLKGISGAAEGKQYWLPTQHYYKAKAYRLTPYAKKGHLSIDGERYPYAPFQVEVHSRMGTTLGGGRWLAEFSLL